jgi:choline dehydrogenase
VLGLLRSDPALVAPDLQILFVDVPLSVPALPGPDQGYALLVSLMTPHSRGSVRLRSADPRIGPRLNPDYLSDPRDIDVLVAGLDLARAIGRAHALDPWRSVEFHPGPDTSTANTLRAYLLSALQTYHHPVGTCRIGDNDTASGDSQTVAAGSGAAAAASALGRGRRQDGLI